MPTQEGIGDTEWSFHSDENKILHAVLAFSTLQPPTHIVLALSVMDPEHLRALVAAVETGYVLLTPLSYFKTMLDDAETQTAASAPIIVATVDPKPVRAFLALPGQPRP